MKRSKVALITSVAALFGALSIPFSAFAASKTQNMPVQAQVNVNCNFTSTPTMDFLTYDPTGVNAAAPLGGSVGVDVRCTKGAVVTIGIDTGANTANAPAGSTRAMKNGTNYLGYDFYHENTYTTLWTNSGGGLYGFTALSNAPTTVTIYGKIPQNQDVPAGLYQDTVVVTVNY